MGAIEALAFEVGDAGGAALLQQYLRREGVEFDVEAIGASRLGPQHAFAGAEAMVALGGERRIAEAVARLVQGAAVIRIGLALEEAPEAVEEARATQGSERAAEHRLHEGAIVEDLVGFRAFDRQPAVPAMTGGVEAETGEKPPEGAMVAGFQAMRVTPHVLGAPGGVGREGGDGIPVGVVGVDEDHRVMSRAAAWRAG